MSNILEDLFLGEICPDERPFDNMQLYEQGMDLINKNTNFLLESLDGIARQKLLQLSNAFAEVLSIVSVGRFTQGAQMGGRLVLAIFRESR